MFNIRTTGKLYVDITEKDGTIKTEELSDSVANIVLNKGWYEFMIDSSWAMWEAQQRGEPVKYRMDAPPPVPKRG